MIRLIRSGLMFGNLFEVGSPTLVERYNRALEHLTGKRTSLTEFHVDISGYAPEIGEELDDPLYLNPSGCNRQFILLSVEQKTAPLLEVKFSTSRDILRSFIEDNEPALFALTTRDAIAGELINSVYDISRPEQLFDIRSVRIEADTIGTHLHDAKALQAKIKRFREEHDAWWDDGLIAEMIELARTAGDITRQPLHLKNQTFEQRNLWTAHFGGLYIFRDLEHPVAIATDGKATMKEVPLTYVFDLTDRKKIAHFLVLNDLVEAITDLRKSDAARLLREKLEFIVVDTAANAGEDLSGAGAQDLRRLARRHRATLPEEFYALIDLLRWIEDGGRRPRLRPEHPAYFYVLRAKPGKDRDLVNMLLAELTPLDARQLFIMHKEAFYTAYRTWPESKKDFVANYLAAVYAADKAGMRAALFGDPMVPSGTRAVRPRVPKTDRRRDILDLVGPWGAVKRT